MPIFYGIFAITMASLYIISTPIGNLEDITFRALRILKEAGLIAAEDTRHTAKLLSYYGIRTKMVSFFEANEIKRLSLLINEMKSGTKVALVSDAGTPAISDPGFKLVRSVVENGLEIEAVPGPSAVITAMAVSGLPTDQFTFVGFLPDKEGKRRAKLNELSSLHHTLVFYVSKWKLSKVLNDMLFIFGERPAVLCRELTKMHEEVTRSTLSGLLQNFKEVKGEITLVVGGKEQ